MNITIIINNGIKNKVLKIGAFLKSFYFVNVFSEILIN